MTTAGSTLRALAVEGPVATITAGWEEREDDDAELDAVLDGRSRNLRLHHRMFDVLEKDPAFAAAALAFRDRHDELLGFYRLRLQGAMEGVYAVQRRTSVHGTGDAALADAVEAVRHIDGWYSHQLKELYRDFDERALLARARSSGGTAASSPACWGSAPRSSSPVATSGPCCGRCGCSPCRSRTPCRSSRGRRVPWR